MAVGGALVLVVPWATAAVALAAGPHAHQHPVWPDAVVVRFKEFGASSLDIEIMAWFPVPDWGQFQLCRQEVLLGFMQVVEEAGTAFAFPTRTVHLVAPGDSSDNPTGHDGADGVSTNDARAFSRCV